MNKFNKLEGEEERRRTTDWNSGFNSLNSIENAANVPYSTERIFELSRPKYPYYVSCGTERFHFIRRPVKFPKIDPIELHRILKIPRITTRSIENTLETTATRRKPMLIIFPIPKQIEKKRICSERISQLAKPKENWYKLKTEGKLHEKHLLPWTSFETSPQIEILKQFPVLPPISKLPKDNIATSENKSEQGNDNIESIENQKTDEQRKLQNLLENNEIRKKYQHLSPLKPKNKTVKYNISVVIKTKKSAEMQDETGEAEVAKVYSETSGKLLQKVNINQKENSMETNEEEEGELKVIKAEENSIYIQNVEDEEIIENQKEDSIKTNEQELKVIMAEERPIYIKNVANEEIIETLPEIQEETSNLMTASEGNNLSIRRN